MSSPAADVTRNVMLAGSAPNDTGGEPVGRTRARKQHKPRHGGELTERYLIGTGFGTLSVARLADK
jgi:hypothetical protein